MTACERSHLVAGRTSCVVSWLGSIAYGPASDLQRDLLNRRLAGEIKDTLLLLEHPPTITIGKSGRLENVLMASADLARQGISVFCTDRGGDVTYHGPGQLVGYPIIDLRQREKDLHKYVRDVEEVVIRTLRSFSIDGARDASHPGVWIDNQEIAAIGIRISRWITMHGFALNISPNLKHFSLINPCGFRDRRATSMSEVLSEDIPREVVMQKLISHFSVVFDTDMAVAARPIGTEYE